MIRNGKVELTNIDFPYIILCEGVDDCNFFKNYLNSDALKQNPKFSKEILLVQFGGVDSLSLSLKALINMDGFENVNKILIIRDAEKDVDKANNMVKKALSDNNLPVPQSCNIWTKKEESPNTAFTLLPNCSTSPVPGTLEDLCWELLACEKYINIKDDVQTFVKNMNDKYNSIKSHEHKSRLHTFFSVNDSFISMKVGEAAKAGAFDWGNEKLTPLKELIEEGF